jgi:hypothetical protein
MTGTAPCVPGSRPGSHPSPSDPDYGGGYGATHHETYRRAKCWSNRIRGKSMARYKFEFQTTGESLALCEDIVGRMMDIFGISEDEALGRVNRQWRGCPFEALDIICHETDDFWANQIYFGNDSCWWSEPAGLKPLPYP